LNNNNCLVLSRREYGILLHPTSLPGGGTGDLGDNACDFVDFLSAAGASVWQVLPLGPTHADRSPYLTLSVHAGNTRLISPQRLVVEGFLDRQQLERAQQDCQGDIAGLKEQCIAQAYLNTGNDAQIKRTVGEFVRQCGHWLPDYALYQALKSRHGGRPWFKWPVPLRDRDPQALAAARTELQPALERIVFGQYLFRRQWVQLKGYANERGIRLFGDLPIFVAHDSADIWSHRKYFQLTGSGRPKVVAGVPPDYFSKDGQRWGNPLYDWSKLAEDDFDWWVQRLRTQLAYFDLLRIDHFRGFESYWEIPAENTTAVHGRWVKGPGEVFFRRLKERLGALPLVAEDLGLITNAVVRLRKTLGLPGMCVLQFAFDGKPDNPHLPHNHDPCSVVYSGTHDNDTTMGWFEGLTAQQKESIYGYLGMPREAMPWALIRAAFQSVSRLAVLPMQDIMGLGSEHRMNTPGQNSSNWQWAFQWHDVDSGTAERLRHLASVYDRIWAVG
jgi:4-alpha-glucanotransferase